MSFTEKQLRHGRVRHEIVHNGFHGIKVLRFTAAGNCGRVEVSAQQARRLNNEVCSGGDCRCGERVARKDGGRWYVDLPDNDKHEIRGHYPQQ